MTSNTNTLTLERLPDWHTRLVEYLLHLRSLSREGALTFGWDPNIPTQMNCIVFASGAVLAITGHDVYGNVEGLEYNDALSAWRTIKSLGFDSLDQLVGSYLEEVRVPLATFGDLVIVSGNSEGMPEGLAQTVGVAEPPYCWVVGSNGGLNRMSMSQARKAYRV